MNDKILFLIMNDEIKFLSNPQVDHHEWYLKLGGKEEDYPQIIKGFIMDGMMIFVRGNLNYDSEVIDVAKKCAPLIRKQLGRPYLKVCCGMNPGQNGGKWEPIVTLTEEELSGASINVQKEQNELLRREEERRRQEEIRNRETSNLIDFKNNWEDPKFIKYATLFTGIMFIIIIITKVILVNNKTILIEDRWMQLLVIVQVISPIITIIGYNLKKKNAKYFGLATTIASFFLFDFIDIIIGVLNLLFTIDQTYIINMLDYCQKTIQKLQKKKEQTNVKKK